MRYLELKIPPLFLFLITALLMWLTTPYLPSPLIKTNTLCLAAILFAISGVIFAFLGVHTFKKTKTTLNPTTPEETSTLVVHGVYKITRNPMYVGFLMLLIAWALFLSNLSLLLLVMAFVIYMNRFQIQVEERFLTSKFPAEYESYKQKVRRWL